MFAELQFVHSFSIHSLAQCELYISTYVPLSLSLSVWVFVSLSPMPQLLTLCRFGISLDVLWSVFAFRHFRCHTARSMATMATFSIRTLSDFHNGGRQYKLMTNTIISVVQIDPYHPPHYVRVLSTLKLIEYFQISSCSVLLLFILFRMPRHCVFSSSFAFFWWRKSKTRYKIYPNTKQWQSIGTPGGTNTMTWRKK